MDFIGGDPARTVKYHGFAPTPPQKFHCCIFSNQDRKQQGAPPGMAMDFIGGDPARTVKYHGFAPTTPQKFHRGISYHQGRKQQGAPPGMANVASGGTPPRLLEAQKKRGGGIFHVVR